MQHDYAITFACYNAVAFTKECIASLVASGTPLDRVVVVDNGSTDGTRDYLSTLPLGGRIFNKDNLACGAAWNQGALHLQAEWTVVMNNDIVVAPGWVETLIGTAVQKGYHVISPAMVEGAKDYDFNAFALDASAKMQQAARRQTQHAVCVCIHRSVFQKIGYFRAHPGLLGFEDTLFFHDLRKTTLQSAIVGSAWIHHFGSITQRDMKRAMGKSDKDDLIQVNDRELLHQSWLERKLSQWQRKRQLAQWQATELQAYGMTLHGERVNKGFVWL